MTLRPTLGLAVAAALAFAPAARAADEKTPPQIAHIKLSGGLDESPAEDNPFGPSENFKSKLDRIKKAKADDKVGALYLEINGLAVGWGKMDELRKAIADFRSTGKKAYAYLEEGGSDDYLVGLACDAVCLPEGGELGLVGMRAEVSFYKDMFEKLHLKADFLQMGDFKGAAEPYTRSSMSPQLRKQFELVIDDYFEHSVVGTIVKSRPDKNWTPEKVKKIIDRGPYTAEAALKEGLVEKVGYADAFEADLKKALKADNAKVVKNYGQEKKEDIDLSSPFAFFKLLAPKKPAKSDKPKVALIYAVGAIETGKGGGDPFTGGSSVGSTTMVEAIQQAEKDPTVKAIVLRVDSPGGSALASDLIWHELNKSKKPVIASMGDVAASGGYYISMAAKKIYAEPGTLTGSIGVVGGKIVTGGLYEWAGIKTDMIVRGSNSGVLSSTNPWSDTERAAVTALMREIYDQFLDKALAGRKKAGIEMTREKLLTLAGGRIWTGRQAKDAGLIDELGTLDDAVAAAKEMAGLKKDDPAELLILPKQKSFFDRLIDKETSLSAVPAEFKALRAVPGFEKHLKHLGAMLRLKSDRVWLMDPVRFEAK